MPLVESLDQLKDLLGPVLRGQVDGGEVAFDTETSEVRDGRFTPYGTDVRMAGFSLSYDVGGRGVDFYVPVRHRPYDWRRPARLVREKAPEWYRRLLEDEHVEPGASCGAWVGGQDPNLPAEDALGLLRRAMAAPGVRWAAHNWGFDGPIVDVEGWEPPWDRIEETQFLSVLTDPRPLDAWDVENERFVHGGHGLKHLGETWLGVPPDAERLLSEAKNVLQCESYAHLPLRTVVAPYACTDTRLVLRLARHCRERDAWADESVRVRYAEEVALIRHLVAMMRRGVPVRADLAAELGREAQAEADRLEAQAGVFARRVSAGAVSGLELRRPAALATQLYDDLGVPEYRGKRDTRKPTLQMLRRRLEDEGESDRAELLGKVLAWRGVTKEIDAFYEPLQRAEGGVVHPLLRQMQAATTRMSAAKPNTQQVKKKGRVREVFVTRPGKVYLFLDYDQIEMRFAAHYSKAVPARFEKLFTWGCTLAKRGDCKGRPPHGPRDDVDACRRVIHVGRYPDVAQRPRRLYLFDGFCTDPEFDPHQRMADVAEVDRDTAKTANFALLYGAGYDKLAETLDCTRERAAELWAYFWKESYPELLYVRDFIAERLRRVGRPTQFSGQDYVRTVRGGRIYLERDYKALSYLIQRGAREVFGRGLLAVADYCEREMGGAYFPLQPVHDEVILEVDRESLDPGVVRRIREMLTEAGSDLLVPVTVGCEVGERSWSKQDREEYVA